MKYLLIILVVFSFSSNAAFCARELSNGNVRLTSIDIDSCTGMIVFEKEDYVNLNSDILNIKESQDDFVDLLTTEYVLSAFTFGFSTQILFWFIGFKIRVANTAIKRF